MGAGHSGSTCAYNLKRFHPAASVLLIDQATFPRVKPCGGGISPDVKNYIDFDISDILNCQQKKIFLVVNQQKIAADCDLWMVRREHFDHFLLKKAQERGVVVKQDCRVTDINNQPSRVVVQTLQGNFTGKIAVIAEGSRGTLAKKLKLTAKNNITAALEYEHYQENPDVPLHIDFEQTKNGYAWIFPKSDGLSIGIGRFSSKKNVPELGLPQQLKKYLHDYHITDIDKKQWHGHPVQLYSGKRKLVYHRILLVGEIAGAVDPLIAEGIRPSIKSGFYAAKILAETIEKNNVRLLRQYDQLFHQMIGKDFQYARIAAYLLFRYFNKTMTSILTHSAAKSFAKVFSGQACYSDYLTARRLLRMVM